MVELLEQNREQIAAVCRRHSVKCLELFGSAARDDFDPLKSDFDFFIEFQDYNSPAIADQWFGFQEDMEKLLGRRVDLTSPRNITNRFFLQVANRSRIPLYAA